MESDRYLKIILTIIATCLVWICIRDVKIGSQRLEAQESHDLGVKIIDVSPTAYRFPVPVMVMNLNPGPEESAEIEK